MIAEAISDPDNYGAATNQTGDPASGGGTPAASAREGNLLGAICWPTGVNFPCQVMDMSPGGMALIAPIAGQPGERVIAYVDHLGRLEGKVARVLRMDLR